ncbi:MAG: hypothetical protein L3J39_16435 [Verrucomicrobiales bacterium]|nr:hypothetical protein [Verrucomicrobiales bacterium]
MGFSFRSLYTDEQRAQPSSTGVSLGRRTAESMSVSRPQAKSAAPSSPPVSPSPTISGIPGPLPQSTADQTVQAISSAGADTSTSDHLALDSLDVLVPEPPVKVADPAPSQAAATEARETQKTTLAAPSAPASQPADSAESARQAKIQLRALFSVNEEFTLDQIATLTVQLPGIRCCLLQNDRRSVLAKSDSDTVQDIDSLNPLPKLDDFKSALSLVGQDHLDGLLLRSANGCVTVFSHAGFALMASHHEENLQAGVWEKLLLICQACAQLRG